MNAQEVLERIVNQNLLVSSNLKWCYVDSDKVPWNGLCRARPNCVEDFKNLEDLDFEIAKKYKGVGISIQASDICAIDLDHCFSDPFVIESADDRAKNIISIFKDLTYIEFSFSGAGLRVLFRASEIPDYGKKYYTKNSKMGCEYYYPQGSNRYVTITGRNISYNTPNFIQFDCLYTFLQKYMVRKERAKSSEILPHTENIDGLLLHFIRTNKGFQDNWFDPAPGFGSNESERDFFMVQFIYENITRNREQIKTIFERSPFFKSKDWMHVKKWNRADCAYFDYLYDVISGER